MNNYLKVAAFLAVCIAVAQCTDAESGPTEAPLSQCTVNKLNKCLEPNIVPYYDAFATWESTGNFISNLTRIENLAAAFETTQTCVENENTETECQGDNADVAVDNEVNFAADFLAVPQNRDLMAAASNSYCLYYDVLIGYVTGDFNDYCVGGLYQALYDPETDLCEAVNTMRSCLLDVTRYYCGNEAAAFVASAYDYGVRTPYGRNWIDNSNLPAFVVNGCYE
ncbi:hypothetical protein ElyMa_000694200 [Elysia marginata]|uniref:DUF19 domain-containing protein n=1 Tax=Elysia marginata TaxID=1093978 RepID=A0AAV4GJZ1_9GAST|nr:hypothetical protein ElyMa_000694200 [Elysia marginata]